MWIYLTNQPSLCPTRILRILDNIPWSGVVDQACFCYHTHTHACASAANITAISTFSTILVVCTSQRRVRRHELGVFDRRSVIRVRARKITHKYGKSAMIVMRAKIIINSPVFFFARQHRNIYECVCANQHVGCGAPTKNTQCCACAPVKM